MKQKKVFIVSAHWNNRGDEAALRSLIDRMLEKDYAVCVELQTGEIVQFPYSNVKTLCEYPRMRHLPEFIVGMLSNGKFCGYRFKEFYNELKSSDLVLHSPGGPSIGDIYSGKELTYLARLWAAKFLGIPYIICAPSAGPFNKKGRNFLRKYIFNNAYKIIFREEISQEYFYQLLPNADSLVTCDLALRNNLPENNFYELLKCDLDLQQFLNKYSKIVGVTITDLMWHPRYSREPIIQEQIKGSFTNFIKYLSDNGFGVIFIPQLFGLHSDCPYMCNFVLDNCFMLDNNFDCYFQQVLISKLYAVVGMRYHSNIFSAKMGTPFVSVSYEQKMKGFVNKIEYSDYCIDINDLSFEQLKEKFNLLEKNYDVVHKNLKDKSEQLMKLSNMTTDIITDYIESWG